MVRLSKGCGMRWSFVQEGIPVGVPGNGGWLVVVGSSARAGVLQPSQECTSSCGVCSVDMHTTDTSNCQQLTDGGMDKCKDTPCVGLSPLKWL